MPLIDYVDADGPLWLEEDIATGLKYEDDGRIITSNKPGLGIEAHPDLPGGKAILPQP
jgi:L-alanine-DL-glutamate epimerase-like enolase superfamily enzyme